MVFQKKKFSDRHKILEALDQKRVDGFGPHAESFFDVELDFPNLVEKSKIDEDSVIKQLDFLSDSKEIYINQRDGSTFYCILQKGTASYHDRKYLYLGKKESLNDFFDIVKTVSAVALLIIAVTSFIINFSNTVKNNKDIETLKRQIEELQKK